MTSRYNSNRWAEILPFVLRDEVAGARLLVVKIGSRILVDGSPAQRGRRLINLAEDIVALMRMGIRVVVVSSGAIAYGMQALNLTRRPTVIPAKQACASIGQARMMYRYESIFAKYGVAVGQVLLTWDDLRDKQRYLNLRNTFFELFNFGVIPIANENDSVGVEEIRFGNNDLLGAQISLLTDADAYIMLTDVNGLYNKNPKDDPTAQHIAVVKRITEKIEALGQCGAEGISVGGMATKIKAAEIVTSAGIYAFIGNGYVGRLRDIVGRNGSATIFEPIGKKIAMRGRWIAFVGKPRGTIAIDEGAHIALVQKGKSLLPAGIENCSGSFAEGDVVEITAGGIAIARGLTNYRAADLQRIKGRHTSEIAKILGQKPFDEAVHRNNLVILRHTLPSYIRG